jgi:hypothetical protein
MSITVLANELIKFLKSEGIDVSRITDMRGEASSYLMSNLMQIMDKAKNEDATIREFKEKADSIEISQELWEMMKKLEK